MSSKVLRPDAGGSATPMAWREMGPGARARPAPEAKPSAAELMQQAERLWEQRVKEAHATGVREGEALGREMASAELRQVVERLAAAIGEVGGLRGRLRQEAEADLVRLALAIARRVLHRELAVDPEALRGLILAGLEKLRGQEVNRVRIHPELAPVLALALKQAGIQPAPEILADAARDKGTLVFETGRGNLDASVETQLGEIERGLADRLRRSGT